jgi:membrane-associated phospholipid phosphatase
VAAVLVLLVLGFITFILFPTVPPWGASTWLHRLPGIYNGFAAVLKAHPLPLEGSPIFYIWHLKGDAVAEIPSEHAAFPMLEYLAFSRIAPRWAGLLLVWVACVAFTVIYLGMHWVIDILAGWLYAVVIFWLVRRVATVSRAGAAVSSR